MQVNCRNWSLLLVVALQSLLLLNQQQSTASGASILESLPGGGLIGRLTESVYSTVGETFESVFGLAGRPAAYLVDSCRAGYDCLAANDPDAKRNVSEIIRSRGFQAQEFDVITDDGYILTIQRIINPFIVAQRRSSLKPIIMQHGLMSSSVDWVINSVNVTPSFWPPSDLPAGGEQTNNINNSLGDSQEHPNSLGFYLANQGFDVFLANSRGNTYGQRHVNLSAWEPRFWAFSFDEQIQFDLPAVIKYVQQLTGHQKVAYVGHSQGTAMMFGLLSVRPDMNDIIEPFIALAPVAFVSNSISPAKYFAVYTPIAEHVNWWFATSNFAVRYLAPIVCGPKIIRQDICANIMFLGTGFNLDELDDSRISAYLGHMPSGTSVKNFAHYGQEVLNGRFSHFDHGILENKIRYGQITAPDYDLTQISSKNIVLFTAENDWLASPKDVAKLKRDLKVEPLAVFNITEEYPKWNHIDFVYAKHAGQVINTKIHEILKRFNHTI